MRPVRLFMLCFHRRSDKKCAEDTPSVNCLGYRLMIGASGKHYASRKWLRVWLNETEQSKKAEALSVFLLRPATLPSEMNHNLKINRIVLRS